jgi:hypothetical protein
MPQSLEKFDLLKIMDITLPQNLWENFMIGGLWPHKGWIALQCLCLVERLGPDTVTRY